MLPSAILLLQTSARAEPLVYSGEVLIGTKAPADAAAYQLPEFNAPGAAQISSGLIHVKPAAPLGAAAEIKRGVTALDKKETAKVCREAIRSLGMREEDVWCEPNFVFAPAALPSDPHAGLMYSIKQMDLENAWELSTGSADVTVAVVDSGIDLSHADLKENLWTNPEEIPANGIDDDANGYVDDVHGADVTSPRSLPLDDIGHGTHVAGIIGARGSNGEGISGVNWQVQLMAVKFISKSGAGSTADAVKAIDYAVKNGANIINASWGSQGGHSLALEAAIKRAGQAGVLFVAAAGNNAENNDSVNFYPASYRLSNLVSVGATDKEGNLAEFSNYGERSVDIAAPGDDIVSCYPGLGYAYLSGTSMAAPQVAGVAALLLSKNPSLTPYDLRSIMLDSAVQAPQLAGAIAGARRLNALQALERAAEFPGSGGSWSMTASISGGKRHAKRFDILAAGAAANAGQTGTITLNLGGKSCALSQFVVSDQAVNIAGRVPAAYQGDLVFNLEFAGLTMDSRTLSVPALQAASRPARRMNFQRICKAIQKSLR